MTESDVLRAHRPDTAPPDDGTRHRALAILAEAARAEAVPRRRILPRIAAITAATAAVAVAMAVGLGAPPSPDGPPDQPWTLGPQPAGALTAVSTADDGSVEVRFLHPSADPERIRAELEAHGLDLEVTFVAGDPFSVGTLVMQDGAAGIEMIDEGTDLTGGGFGQTVGIRVPAGWSGSGQLAIARAAEPGEDFQSSVVLNAERPGGPLHCVDVRGLRATAAAAAVEAQGLEVEWRTERRGLMGMRTEAEEPPNGFRIHDVLWSAADEVMLFAAAGEPEPLSDAAAELVGRDCDGGTP